MVVHRHTDIAKIMSTFTHIENLKILIFLLDKKLLIELFDEIHLFVPMEEMIERFENSPILD